MQVVVKGQNFQKTQYFSTCYAGCSVLKNFGGKNYEHFSTCYAGCSARSQSDSVRYVT